MSVYSINSVEIGNLYYTLNSENNTAVVSPWWNAPVYQTKTYHGDIVIPANVTYNGVKYKIMGIEEGAFSNCVSVSSVTIANGITTIGPAAFQRCAEMTSIVIPNSITSIGANAFENCYS